MSKRVSSKTHTKAQLDHNANVHNPNNKAYRANMENQRKNQKLNSKNFHSYYGDVPTSQFYYGWCLD